MNVNKFIGLIFGILFTSCDNKVPGYYEDGDRDYRSVKINQVFKVAFHENPTTGYSYHWINKSECKSLILIDKEFINREVSKNIVIGGKGGTTVLYFTGKTIGRDTIKLVNCPPSFKGECLKNYIAKKIKTDIEILVDIK